MRTASLGWKGRLGTWVVAGALAPGAVSTASAAAAQQGTMPAAPRPGAEAEAPARTADEVVALRASLEALRQEYSGRIAAIESRLAALEQQSGAPAPETAPAIATAPAESPAAAVEAPVPAGAVAEAPAPAAAPAPQAPAATAVVPMGAAGEGAATSLPVYGGGAASSKVFNPDMAAIGNFVGVMGPTPGGGEPSLSLQESEVSFQAVVDPYARADFFLTFGPEEVGVEEGYITFPTLPGGLLAKVGKMREAFGRVNTEHPHTLPFADLPLLSRNLLGGEALSDSGLSVARLVPVPGFFLEATGQVYRGESDVFKAPTRGDLQYVGRLRAYQDITESTNLDVGGSIAYGNNGVTPDSKTRLLGADLTLRYRPLRRSIYTSLLARGEAVWSRREDPAGTVDAFGAYGYLGYQFARRWTAGVRLDTSDRAELAGVRDKGGSFILTYRPSEFSLVRAQYRRTTFGQESPVNELLFQFLFAIGAHGAHPF
jgi:hypothetical protein